MKRRGHEQIVGPDACGPHQKHVQIAQEDHQREWREDDKLNDPGRANSNARCRRRLGSSSMNPAPRKNIRQFGLTCRGGANQ